MSTRNAAQIDLMITSCSLRKDTLKNQIMQINAAINKKQSSITTFRNYADSYDKRVGSPLLQTVQIVQNNHAFYQQLAKVIMTEQTELQRLEGIKTDLVSGYLDLTNQLEGLESIRKEIRLQRETQLDKRDESDLSDLSVMVKTREKTWNR